MKKLLIGLLIGLIAGGAGVFFLFIGVPRAAQTPGAPIKPPDANVAAGSALIVLRQEFFNEALNAVFKDMNPPAFPIAIAANGRGDSEFQYAAFQDSTPC